MAGPRWPAIMTLNNTAALPRRGRMARWPGPKMQIGEAYRRLGPVSAVSLQAALLEQDERTWLEDDSRQRNFEVHRQTESIILLFCDGWPEITVSRHTGWTRLAPLAEPLMDDIIARWYPQGGRVIRAMAARLQPGRRIDPHRDTHPSFEVSHRIHVPLQTGPGVRFTVDGKPCPMRVGEAIEINNQLTHSVVNLGREPRITFIFDYLPPEHEPPAAAEAER